MINSIKRKWSKITGKRYWYQVKYTYKDPRGNSVFGIELQVGLGLKDDILNTRGLKKMHPPLHKDKKVKHLLSNGSLNVTVITYLGYLKK